MSVLFLIFLFQMCSSQRCGATSLLHSLIICNHWLSASRKQSLHRIRESGRRHSYLSGYLPTSFPSRLFSGLGAGREKPGKTFGTRLPFVAWNTRNFKLEYLVERKAPDFTTNRLPVTCADKNLTVSATVVTVGQSHFFNNS